MTADPRPATDPARQVGEVELVRVRLPLVQQHRAAHGTESVRDLVLVRVTLADGATGWGECSALTRPTYTAEYTAGAWLVLRDELAPALLAGRRSPVVGHPMARAALETAGLDAELRRSGCSLAEHLSDRAGTSTVEAVERTAVVSLGDGIDDLLAVVAARVAEGAVMVKLKITPERPHLEAVRAVRSTWPDLALAADANGTADAELVGRLAPLGLSYLEQPAPADDLVSSARLAKGSDIPIALDESIAGAGDFESAVAIGAGSVLNVKPARVGGVETAADLVATAGERGWRTLVGGMLETGIGRAAAAAVAALPGCDLPTDLGPSHRYFDPDVTGPVVLDQAGRLVVPVGAGIGRIPDPGHLAAATIDRHVLSR